jgi:hypothetical protein
MRPKFDLTVTEYILDSLTALHERSILQRQQRLTSTLGSRPLPFASLACASCDETRDGDDQGDYCLQVVCGCCYYYSRVSSLPVPSHYRTPQQQRHQYPPRGDGARLANEMAQMEAPPRFSAGRATTAGVDAIYLGIEGYYGSVEDNS